jgi:hypothetical protein
MEIVALYQDNKSIELLMTNRRFSSGKRTKHIKAKFFFIKDRIDNKEMRVVCVCVSGLRFRGGVL